MPECKICFNHYNDTVHYPLMLTCGHTFCRTCVQAIRNKDNLCPLDRSPITAEPIPNRQLVEVLQDSKLNKNLEGLFKIAFVGHQSVGKTSTMRAFKGQQFRENNEPTVGYNFEYVDDMYNKKAYRIQIWDTAGEERYRSVLKTHYQNAHMIIVEFDLSDEKTFKDVPYWLREIHENADEDVIVLLIGNKSDLKMCLGKAQLDKFAEQKQLTLEIISCSKGWNVAATWKKIIKALVQKFDTKNSPTKGEAKRKSKLQIRSAIESDAIQLDQTASKLPAKQQKRWCWLF